MSTLRDVATAARVSVSTASRYIRQDGYVSPEAAERVQAAMRQLGYHPNGIARSLRHQRTHTLALVVPEIENPFFTTISRGVEDVANAAGYAVVFCNTDEQHEKQERYLHTLLERKIDGLLFAPCGERTAEHCRMLAAAGVPYIFIDREIPGVADAVLSDNIGGARQVVEHLLALGHRRIALVGGSPNDSVSRERRAGYGAALAGAGITFDTTLVREGDWSMASAWQLTHDLLALDSPPAALFCTNNVLAVGALVALREAGRRVPEDMALVCFDDVELASLIDPFLTVAMQPAYEMGRRATRLLLDRVAGGRSGDPVRDVLPVRLIVRRSCGSPTPSDRGHLPTEGLPGRQWRAGNDPRMALSAGMMAADAGPRATPRRSAPPSIAGGDGKDGGGGRRRGAPRDRRPLGPREKREGVTVPPAEQPRHA